MTTLLALDIGRENRRIVQLVVLAQDRLQRFRRLQQVIVRDLREEHMVDHVRTDVVHQVVDHSPVTTIHRRQRTLQETPRIVTIVRQRAVRVVQIGDEIQPGDEEEVRHEVGIQQDTHREGHKEEDQPADDAHRRAKRTNSLFLREQTTRPEVEVIPARELAIQHQVDRIHDQQRMREPNDLTHTCDHSLMQKFEVARLRDRLPRVIILNVVVILVVFAMRDAPSMERHKQRRVSDVTENVTPHHVLAEGAMATVMTDDEQTPPEETDEVPPDDKKESNIKKGYQPTVHSKSSDTRPDANKCVDCADASPSVYA